MTYEQDMAVREKYWYKDGLEAGIEAGAARQKAEDDVIIQNILNENAKLKAELAKKSLNESSIQK